MGRRSCQNRHTGYVTVGSLQVTMDDGTEIVIGAGDGYEIPPGHDVLVIGDEPFEAIEFTSADTFGLLPEELGSASSRPFSSLTLSARPRWPNGSATARGRACSKSTT